MDVDAAAGQMVANLEMYLAAFNDGANARPMQMAAFRAYRAGWIDGVESRDSHLA